MSYPASPSLQWILGSVLHLPWYNAPLRLPHPHLRDFALWAHLKIPCIPRFLCVPFPRLLFCRRLSRILRLSPEARTKFINRRDPYVRHFDSKERCGSPKFPSFPFEYMPRSRTTVVSFDLAKTILGLLPSGTSDTVGFPPRFLRKLSLPQRHNFSRLNSAACILDHLSFRLPLPGLPVRFTTNLLAKL